MSAELHPAGPPQGAGRTLLQRIEVLRGPPIHEPALDDPERIVLVPGRVRGEDQARTDMGGLERAPEPVEHGLQPPPAAAQRSRAFVALLGGRGPHLALDVVQQRPPRLLRR